MRRIRVYSEESGAWELVEPQPAAQGDWRAAGKRAAEVHGVRLDFVAVEIDAKVGFVRCSI